jgi:sigma-B regulation protein RsbU (phosphoserine phosphatase)
MQVEASSLFLVNEASGDLDLVIARGPAQGQLENAVSVPRSQGIAGWVLAHRRSLLVADAYQDPRFYSKIDEGSGFVTRSVLCTPLFQADTQIGVLEVLNPRGKNQFDQLDLEAFEAYGNLVATAIAKLRAIERDRNRQLLEKDLALAYELQHSLLPDHLPATLQLSFARFYRPAQEIAGDFYDVFERNPGEFYFVVGDVSGKGISAAIMMAQALSMLRLIALPGVSPSEVLKRWNLRLCTRTIHGMFITAVLGRIVPEAGLLEFAAAGHTAPVIRNAKGEVTQSPIAASAPLGIAPEMVYPVNQMKLLPGDHAVFYTDGLTESFDENRQALTMATIMESLVRPLADPEAVVNALVELEARHRGDKPPHDDLTILAFGLR